MYAYTWKPYGTYYREEQTVRVQNRLFIDSVQRATSGFKIFQIAIAIQKETNDEEFMDKDILWLRSFNEYYRGFISAIFSREGLRGDPQMSVVS